MTDLRYAIHRDTDKTGARIDLLLSGVLDREAQRDLARTLRAAFGRSRSVTVIVDVTEVTHIGSECIELLLLGYAQALRGGHGYEIVGATGHVRLALEATGLVARTPSLYAPLDVDLVAPFEPAPQF